MQAASNALFDELVKLLDNDYHVYSGIIELRCDQRVAEIVQEEKSRLGGMPRVQ